MTPKLLQCVTDDDSGILSAAPVREAWIAGDEIASHLDRYSIRIVCKDDVIAADFGDITDKVVAEFLIDLDRLTARVMAYLDDHVDFLGAQPGRRDDQDVFAYFPDRTLAQQSVILSPDFQVVDAA